MYLHKCHNKTAYLNGLLWSYSLAKIGIYSHLKSKIMTLEVVILVYSYYKSFGKTRSQISGAKGMIGNKEMKVLMI